MMKSLSNPRIRLFWFLHTLACCILLFLGLVLLLESILTVSPGHIDFCQDYIAAARLIHGIPPYLPLHVWKGPYPCSLPADYDAHPPASVLLFVPFAILPQTLSTMLWGFCLLIAYLASGVLLLHSLHWLSLRGIAIFAIASVYWQPLIGANEALNLWQILVFLLVASWLLERKGHHRWAGGLLGLAGLLKIWPAALLLGTMARGRWWLTLVGTLVIVLGSILAWLFMGSNAYATYLGPARTGETESIPVVGNISLAGAVVRLLVGVPPYLPPAIRGLTQNQALLLGEGLSIFLLLGTVVFIWRCYRHRSCQIVHELSQGLLITILLLAFPVSWHFAFILLILPGAILILQLRQIQRLPHWWFALLAASLLLFLAPYSLFTFAEQLLEERATGLAMLLFDLPTVFLGLFASLQWYLLWRGTKQSNPDKRTPQVFFESALP